MANKKLRSQLDLFNRFVDIAQADLKDLQSNLIYVEGNECHAFGSYRISIAEPVHVWEKDHYQGSFSSTRSAMAWCTASKFRYFQLAELIKKFDERLQVAEQAVKTRQFSNKNMDAVKVAKLQQRISQKFKAQQELEKYVSQAKYLQLRGFNNDTQRNSRFKT